MAKLTIYESGERYIVDETFGMGIWGGNIVGEIDLIKATEEELGSLRLDPYNDTLIDEIVKRT